MCARYGPLIGHVDSRAFHGYALTSVMTERLTRGAAFRRLKLSLGTWWSKSCASSALDTVPASYSSQLRACSSLAVDRTCSLSGRRWVGFCTSDGLMCAVSGRMMRPAQHCSNLQASGRKWPTAFVSCRCASTALFRSTRTCGRCAEHDSVCGFSWSNKQFATRNYLPTLVGKSLTDRIYRTIGEHFRALHGEYAGWAHSVRLCGKRR
jgi:hypothetical protein